MAVCHNTHNRLMLNYHSRPFHKWVTVLLFLSLGHLVCKVQRQHQQLLNLHFACSLYFKRRSWDRWQKCVKVGTHSHVSTNSLVLFQRLCDSFPPFSNLLITHLPHYFCSLLHDCSETSQIMNWWWDAPEVDQNSSPTSAHQTAGRPQQSIICI